MKILYFGTVCNKKNYMEMMDTFRIKPSIAPFVFESALIRGFRENDVDLEAISFPAIPAYPKSKFLAWGNRKETLESGYSTTWIGAINISGIKQICQRISSHILLRKWLKTNADEEKAVLIYSAYQPISKSIVSLCKKYHTKCFAIIPDLPRDMYNVAKIKPIKKVLSKIYVRAAEKVQGSFDGYIYLTDAMKEVINPQAPYTVVEGVADTSWAQDLTLQDKAPGFVIMYAGALYEKYGLKNLVEAFLQIEREDAQLWLFGSGSFSEQLQEYAKRDPRIRFFGRVDRQQILEYEKQATLLVNVRDDKDAFTRYSFPSKVIEYMLSGTPMFITKLSGIPEEYYKYTFSVNGNESRTLAEELKIISSKTSEELLAIGAAAQKFIKEEKCSCKQAERILNFMAQLQTKK